MRRGEEHLRCANGDGLDLRRRACHRGSWASGCSRRRSDDGSLPADLFRPARQRQSLQCADRRDCRQGCLLCDRPRRGCRHPDRTTDWRPRRAIGKAQRQRPAVLDGAQYRTPRRYRLGRLRHRAERGLPGRQGERRPLDRLLPDSGRGAPLRRSVRHGRCLHGPSFRAGPRIAGNLVGRSQDGRSKDCLRAGTGQRSSLPKPDPGSPRAGRAAAGCRRGPQIHRVCRSRKRGPHRRLRRGDRSRSRIGHARRYGACRGEAVCPRPRPARHPRGRSHQGEPDCHL